MHYFIIQTTKMMILWMRQKYVKNGIIKSKTLHLHIYIEFINKIHRDRDSKVLSDLVLVYSELLRRG